MKIENSLPAQSFRDMTVEDIHDIYGDDRYVVTCPLQNRNCAYGAKKEHSTMADYQAEKLVKWPWCESCGCDLIIVDTYPEGDDGP